MLEGTCAYLGLALTLVRERRVLARLIALLRLLVLLGGLSKVQVVLVILLRR